MWGKHFASMYEGSMYGIGAVPLAVWGYVISHFDDKGYLELNPRMLADVIGESEEDIQAAIEKFQEPDPNSRCKLDEGRRLVREGQFLFRVPSAPDYREIWKKEHRREYLRRKQREYRAAQKRAQEAGEPEPEPPEPEDPDDLGDPFEDEE